MSDFGKLSLHTLKFNRILTIIKKEYAMPGEAEHPDTVKDGVSAVGPCVAAARVLRFLPSLYIGPRIDEGEGIWHGRDEFR